MLLNLRGVSTPDEWENANDAKLNGILCDLPVLVIGNPNRDVNSQGEIIEHQPAYTEESGWPENYEIARSRSEKESFWLEKPGDVTSQGKSQGSGCRMSKGERRLSEGRRHSYDLEGGRSQTAVASGSRSAGLTPNSSPRTLVHQQRSVDSGTTEMDAPLTPRNVTPGLLTVDFGPRVSPFLSQKRHGFARPTSSIIFEDP